MAECLQFEVGKRYLCYQSRHTYYEQIELVVLEISPSGVFMKCRNPMKDTIFWAETKDHPIIEELPLQKE